MSHLNFSHIQSFTQLDILQTQLRSGTLLQGTVEATHLRFEPGNLSVATPGSPSYGATLGLVNRL